MSIFQQGTFLLLMLMLIGISASAQDRDISVTQGTYSVHELLRNVRQQGVPLAYSLDRIPNSTCILPEDINSLSELFTLLQNQVGLTISASNQQYLLTYTPPANRQYIRGIIRDASSGEVLIGATVYMKSSESGVSSNTYGFYSLEVLEGSHIVEVNYIGYHPLVDTIEVNGSNQTLDFNLTPQPQQLNEVVVSAYEPKLNVTSPIPGVNTLNLNTKGQIPYFLGEVDVLQGATLLPGITTLGEDANGLSVRGGNVDQNLILLDEATVYNPNHLYGMISIFNPEAVNKIEIIKGFIPPSYGGRASSVMTVHQKEGDYNSFHVTGGIGIVSARIIAEGPLKRNKSSFIVSARQSLFDLTLDQNTTNYFQDFNAKTNWKVNAKNTFYLSGYLGNDRSTNVFDTDRVWGNRNLSARWNHLFGHRVFANFSAIVSQYNYKITQPREAASFIGQSQIVDYTLKSDWGFIINNNHEINFGGSSVFHRLKPGERIPFDEESSSDTLILDTETGLESAFYLSHEANLDRFKLLYGLRLSSLINYGPGDVYEYTPDLPLLDENITDTMSYRSFEPINTYVGLEPRASIVYQWNQNLSTKISYTKTYQYLHLISNTVTPTPTDIWKLSDSYIKPTQSHHISLGWFFNLKDDKYEAFVDGYYKLLNDLLEYKNGADLLFNNNPETELISGKGRNYGVEFFLKKNAGKVTGWLSYTLSRSEVRIDSPFGSVNNGNYFPSNFDRKHDVTLVGIYEISPRLFASLTFNYNSGRPFTLPQGKYKFEDIQVPHFESRNQSRLPAYHRLDISLKWHTKNTHSDGSPKRFNDYWTLNVYNVYGRKNVYSYVFDQNASGQTTVTPYSIIDIVVPSITYHFRF
ncbi:TonB-dependent receptor [Marinoscillum sp.]|uniref:TonB-dependent receptor n=1 Tax=Marinoscillum sp. TaxID=2024838 RepID=UPI003BAA5013